MIWKSNLIYPQDLQTTYVDSFVIHWPMACPGTGKRASLRPDGCYPADQSKSKQCRVVEGVDFFLRLNIIPYGVEKSMKNEKIFLLEHTEYKNGSTLPAFLLQFFFQSHCRHQNRLKIHIRGCRWLIFCSNTSSGMNFQTIWLPKVILPKKLSQKTGQVEPFLS